MTKCAAWNWQSWFLVALKENGLYVSGKMTFKAEFKESGQSEVEL